MSNGWIICGPDVPGKQQMAIDRQMLEKTESDHLTRIRLYHFVPPTISLGFHQKVDDIDTDAAREAGFDIEPRPTGGRAVLHKGDLVYSISIAAKGVDAGSPLHIGVYNRVSNALIRGFRSIGIPAETAEEKALGKLAGDLPKLCFSSATKHEVQIDGRKVVGSAQRRGKNAVLQHGSILVTDEHLELVNVLSGLDDAARVRISDTMRKRTISLTSAGLTCSVGELRDVLCRSFISEFNVPEHKRDSLNVDIQVS